jgi:hypothetical protein
VNERPFLSVEWKAADKEPLELPVHSTEFRLLGSLLPEIMKELQRLAALNQED